MKLHQYTITIPAGRPDLDGIKRPEQTFTTVGINAAHALGNVRSQLQRATQSMKLPKWFLSARVTKH